MICNNITVENGILHFAGQDTTKLAKEYGTPLYLMDEDKIREKCRAYKRAFRSISDHLHSHYMRPKHAASNVCMRL